MNVGIMECAAKQRWVSEQPFEITGDTHAIGTPKRSRLYHKKVFFFLFFLKNF
jgi:hypothetical protein